MRTKVLRTHTTQLYSFTWFVMRSVLSALRARVLHTEVQLTLTAACLQCH